MKISLKQMQYMLKQGRMSGLRKARGAVYQTGNLVVRGAKATGNHTIYTGRVLHNDPTALGAATGAVTGALYGASNWGREPQNKATGKKRVFRAIGGTLGGAWMGGAAAVLLSGRKAGNR